MGKTSNNNPESRRKPGHQDKSGHHKPGNQGKPGHQGKPGRRDNKGHRAHRDHRIVTHVRVICHRLGEIGENVRHNHWSIYLLINDRVSSVRLNMTKDYENMSGKLEITPHQYVLTNSCIKCWDFAVNVSDSITVDHFLHLLVRQNRRHLYGMSENGTGCRYWM